MGIKELFQRVVLRKRPEPRPIPFGEIGNRVHHWSRYDVQDEEVAEAIRSVPRHHADGLFYLDTREPHIVSNIAVVTMTTTAKAMYPAAAFPTLGAGYFSRPGKTIKVSVSGLMTLPATPGNISFNVLWGTGADANGTVLLTGTPVAATNATKRFYLECTVRCITTGTAGGLQAWYWCLFDAGLVASPNTIYFAPAGVVGASVASDTTAANIISIQPLQSGTAGTVLVDDLRVEALN